VAIAYRSPLHCNVWEVPWARAALVGFVYRGEAGRRDRTGSPSVTVYSTPLIRITRAVILTPQARKTCPAHYRWRYAGR